MDFKGKIDLKHPEHTFGVMEYYGAVNSGRPEEPFQIYLGRWVSFGTKGVPFSCCSTGKNVHRFYFHFGSLSLSDLWWSEGACEGLWLADTTLHLKHDNGSSFVTSYVQHGSCAARCHCVRSLRWLRWVCLEKYAANCLRSCKNSVFGLGAWGWNSRFCCTCKTEKRMMCDISGVWPCGFPRYRQFIGGVWSGGCLHNRKWHRLQTSAWIRFVCFLKWTALFWFVTV